MLKRSSWNNVILLSVAQALFQTASVLVFTLAALVGLGLTNDKSLATLPIAAISIGTAIMMIPASVFIRKIGAKKSFMIGASLGLLAGFLAFYAIIKASFILFLISNLLIGFYQAFSQYYRFAAADNVEEVKKGKAISFVIAGGVFAAILGTNIAKYTQGIGKIPFAYSFLSISILSILALVVLYFLNIRLNLDAKNTKAIKARPIWQIIKQNKTKKALLSSAIGYAIMVLIMTATPIAMHDLGFDNKSSANVIQYHILGMYVPSFFTGFLIEKYGINKIIYTGIFLYFIQLLFAILGTSYSYFIISLILLGVAWNFMFIGGSTLLAQSYNLAEKEKTQAFHDFLVFIIISLSSFAAGPLLKYVAWEHINLLSIPLLVLMLWAMFKFKEKAKI